MYDFQTIISRKGQASSKWEHMYEKKPNVPEDIVPLSVADMEFLTPPEIAAGLSEYMQGLVMGYTHDTSRYREVVCDWMRRRHGFDAKPEWICTSAGVVPAFFSVVRAFTRPGEGVIVLPPVYYPFYMAIEEQERKVVTNPLKLKDGRYSIDYDGLAKACADPNNKLLLFCSPHNPVGRIWSPEELREVAKICLENDVLLCSDEIHFDLEMPGHKHTVLQTLGEEFADNCITCTAPSKTFNLAGLQVSNIFIKNEKHRAAFEKAQSSIAAGTLNIFAYKACEIAYTQCESWLDELLGVIEGNARFVESFFAEHIPEIRVFPVEGTYLQWWDCRGMGMETKELEKFMEDEALLFLDEGYIFGEEGAGFERINLACPRAVLEAALTRLANAWKGKKALG